MSKLRQLREKYDRIPLGAKAALWFMFANTMQKGISLISTPIFTRIMSQEQYGQFSAYNSWLQIFTIFTTLRLNYAVFNKGMSKFKDSRTDYTSTMQSITFLTASVLLVIYFLFHRQLDALTELPTYVMLALFAELLVTPAVDFWTVHKRYEYEYKQVVFRTLGYTLINTLLGMAVVMLSTEKGYARILSCIAVNVCFGVTIFIYNRRRAKVWFRWEYAKFALGFNLRLVPHYISQYILDQFDRIMIQKMVSMATTGVYSVAYNAGMLLKILTNAVNSGLIPWQYEQLEKKELKKLDDVLFLVYALVAGVTLTFTAFAPEVMHILAPAKYYEAVYAIPPVALGLFFYFMYNTIANVEFFYEQTRYTVFISMSGAALNIVLNYFGIKLFGYIAAAYTTLICYILFCAAHYVCTTICVKRFLGMSKVFNTGRLVVLSAVVLVLGLSIALIYDRMLIRYGVIALLAGVGFWKRRVLMQTLKTVKSAKKKKK